MTEYSREAELLAPSLVPNADPISSPASWQSAVRMAKRAIDAGWVQRDDLVAQGWTPPTDSHEDIAREMYAGMFTSPWNPERSDIACDLLATVRRIPDDLARQVAEALRGES